MKNKRFTKKSAWLHTVIFSLLCSGTIAVGQTFAQAGSHPQITNGSSSFQFTDEKGNTDKTIRVCFFRPQTLTTNSPIVFVMHGVNRDAQRYCNDWAPYARKYNFLLVCPEFDAANFPSQAYQRGNMFDQSKRAIPEAKWTFTTIENLFDYVKTLTANSSKSYYIYGHSAGGQFVHRFALFMPNARYERAVAANPGWYTMPNYSGHKFPYGLRDSNLSERNLKTSFGRNFFLLLGEDDVNSQDPELKQTRDAEEQGATRFARGQNYFREAQSEATALGVQLRWQLQVVPSAHHSDAQMAQAAAAAFFAK
jgi:pimeloyl-ACP methyl ester carboxylesterase